MKIEFSIDGGFANLPGMKKPVTIDAAQLPPAHCERLRKLVERARFFDAVPAPMASAARDAQCYTIAVEDGARKRTMTMSEPIVDAAMRDLVGEIRACADDMRRNRPPRA
jgi:hypothetical protein